MSSPTRSLSSRSLTEVTRKLNRCSLGSEYARGGATNIWCSSQHRNYGMGKINGRNFLVVEAIQQRLKAVNTSLKSSSVRRKTPRRKDIALALHAVETQLFGPHKKMRWPANRKAGVLSSQYSCARMNSNKYRTNYFNNYSDSQMLDISTISDTRSSSKIDGFKKSNNRWN